METLLETASAEQQAPCSRQSSGKDCRVVGTEFAGVPGAYWKAAGLHSLCWNPEEDGLIPVTATG